MLGFAVTGSFCNFEKCLKILEGLSQKYDEILPILSYNAYSTDTRFGTASYFVSRIEKLCCHEAVHTLTAAVYFVPLRQDDPNGKPYSLVCDFGRVDETIEAAVQGRQLQPLFL